MNYQYDLTIADLRLRICSLFPVNLPECFRPFLAEVSPVKPDFSILLYTDADFPYAIQKTDTVQRYEWKNGQYITRAEPRDEPDKIYLVIPEAFRESFSQNANWLLYLAPERMLIKRERVILHASAVLYEGFAYLFTAPSGGGKSTQARIWENHLHAEVMNGDKVILRGNNSKTYPWLAGGDNTLCIGGASYGVAEDNGKYITQDEMREIAEFAKLYHVEIIPSLDSPGHMNYAVKKYNAKYGTDIGNYFHYNGKTAIVQGSGPEAAQKNYSRGIDISNKEAVTFAKNLYAEYAAFFKELGCTKFDIGGDELLGWGSAVVSTSTAPRWQQLDHWKAYAQKRSGNSKAVAYDAFMYYMNDIYDLVKSYGYTSIRMWNDDALRSADTGWSKVVTLNPGMEIQYWTPTANNSKNNIWTYLNAGYKAYNFLNDYNYYVLGQAHDGSGYAGITPQRIYENWAPNIFTPYGKDGSNTTIGNTNVKGSAFCVWCDKPSTESADTVKAGIIPCLRMSGAKAWDADLNGTISYSRAQQLLKLIGNAPANLPAAPEIKRYTMPDMTALKAAVAEYDTIDAALYTELSFSKYTSAVNSGKAVLSAKKPTQADVDSALSAINAAKVALELIVKVDFSALDKELSIFDGTNGKDYTAETYTAYKVYAADARVIRSSEDVSQESVNAAAERLAYLRSQLRLADMIASEDENWFLSLAAKSKKADRGKIFIFTAYVRKDLNITGYEVYDENVQRVELRALGLISSVRLKNVKEGAQICLNAEVKGEHTYTFYAVNADGVRSPDCRSIDVLVR